MKGSTHSHPNPTFDRIAQVGGIVLAIVMFAVGIQFLLMGLLAEMLVRTYHESQAKPIYAVREKLGFRNRESS